jgi:phosphopantothenoylcysteine synthetase/decarboxylase
VVPPISKLLACGDHGFGAMAEVDDVVEAAVTLLEQQRAATQERRAEILGIELANGAE